MRFILAIIICLNLLYSITLFGDVYDAEEFEKLDNVVIKISGETTLQFIVNNSYNIKLNPGNYTIYAYKYDMGKLKYFTKDQVLAVEESQQFDLVLLPSEFADIYDLDFDLPNAEDIPKQQPNFIDSIVNGIVILAALVVIAGVIYLITKTKTEKSLSNIPGDQQSAHKNIDEDEVPELDDDCKIVLKILEENEGRMIQKEIREILNFSETKMSLLVAELETLGRIKRIKKGRENILKIIKTDTKTN